MKNNGIDWNDEKNEINKRKRHISFDLAQFIFEDEMRIERVDDSESNVSGEERLQTVGKVGKVLFVVFTERCVKDVDVKLIISARLATAQEKRSYYGRDAANQKRWSKAD